MRKAPVALLIALLFNSVCTFAQPQAPRTSNEFADYAGKYTNDLHGTIEITARENALAVRMGKINTVSTPFTEKETIRVEMLPGGSGEVIRFNLTGDRPDSLTYARADFKRITP